MCLLRMEAQQAAAPSSNASPKMSNKVKIGIAVVVCILIACLVYFMLPSRKKNTPPPPSNMKYGPSGTSPVITQHTQTTTTATTAQHAQTATTAQTTTPTPYTAPTQSSTPAPVGSSKKGFVYDLKNNPKFNQQMQSLNLGWYYTWGMTGSPGLNLKFTPMVWGAPDAQRLSQIPQGSTELLAFNEPDGNQPGAQSNISIQNVLSLWPTLKAAGLRLGSVAASQNPLSTSYTPNDGTPALTTSYFDSLWTKLTQANMQPDFIALHWYAPPDANGFLNWIDAIYAKYKKPIWITEMCVADWTATTAKPEKFTTAQIQTFMDQVVAGMNQRSYVEKYSWKTRPVSDIYMGNGALIADDGSLTPLGQHYASL